jgi:serine O-acetyltransferase
MLFGRLVVSIHRFGYFIYFNIKIPVIRQLLFIFYHFINITFARGLCNCEIYAHCKIGNNLTLLHNGNGVIIHPDAVIGHNVTLYHQVTIGQRERTGGVPKINNGVIIGAGAKVLGDIVIGENAKIGANAVVLTDVPANSTAVGIPAKIIVKKEKMVNANNF